MKLISNTIALAIFEGSFLLNRIAASFCLNFSNVILNLGYFTASALFNLPSLMLVLERGIYVAIFCSSSSENPSNYEGLSNSHLSILSIFNLLLAAVDYS